MGIALINHYIISWHVRLFYIFQQNQNCYQKRFFSKPWSQGARQIQITLKVTAWGHEGPE